MSGTIGHIITQAFKQGAQIGNNSEQNSYS